MKHLTERQLAALFQGSLPVEMEERVLLHLAHCETCERKTEPAVHQYRALRRSAAKEIPPPPHRWRDIEMEMDRLDAALSKPVRPKSFRMPRPGWSSLAAGAVMCAVLLLWPRPDASLRAETLLPQIQAAVLRVPSRARQGLRVNTSTATFVRPAVLDVADHSDRRWRERFLAAHYDWDDPLSPKAFSEWRQSVKRRSDRVIVSSVSAGAPRLLTIQTTAEGGPLRDASLTVDAASLLPVRARFVFSDDDWMEISTMSSLPRATEVEAMPGRIVPKLVEPGETVTAPAQSPQTRSQAATELAVWLAADRLSDPAGEPIRMEVRLGNRISVTPYSLNAAQLQQLSASLQEIPGVELQISASSQISPAAQPERDPLIDLSEKIFSRSHLLAKLAGHFPESVEMELNRSARIELWEMRYRQASQLEREIQALAAGVQKSAQESAGQSIGESAQASSLLERLVKQSGRVNRSVMAAAAERAGNASGAAPSPQLAEEIALLKEMAAEYTSTVARELEKLR